MEAPLNAIGFDSQVLQVYDTVPPAVEEQSGNWTTGIGFIRFQWGIVVRSAMMVLIGGV